METHVHYPTDINLLWDAMAKLITLIAALSQVSGLTLWRQSEFNLRQLKKLYRRAQTLKHSTSQDEDKREAQQQAMIQAHQDYLQRAQELLDKVLMTLSLITLSSPTAAGQIIEIERFVAHAKRQIKQIERRVVRGQKIPHAEKVFSVFQPHTEWISKGKAGVPVELGLRVCVLEDQLGFILHHHVMERQTDDQVAVDMVLKAQKRFPDLRACSFDKGFHSPANQMALRDCLELSVLPKKGRLNQADKARETAKEFQAARRQHSAVESAINALEVHGLDVCPDHGIVGFKRYVAMAVLARNIQKFGAELLKQDRAVEQRKRAA